MFTKYLFLKTAKLDELVANLFLLHHVDGSLEQATFLFYYLLQI